MSFARLWVVLAVGLPALVALVVALPAVDLAYQVRTGEEILRTGALPGVDTYTFSVAGQPWTDQQWLAQVLLAAVHRLGGWELLGVLRGVLVAGITGAVVAVAQARGAGSRGAAALALLAFGLMAPALALRPQLFGILLFALLAWLVAGRDRHPRRLLLAPLLVALWANVHGSFVLAVPLLGYALLDDLVRGRGTAARRDGAVLVGAVVASCVTPSGPGVWAYAASIGANPVIAGQVSEWQRTSPLTVTGILFYASVVATAAVLWRGRAALSRADWVLGAGLVAIGAWSVRGVAWWPVAMVLLVATTLPALVPARRAPESRGSGRLNALVAGLLGVVVFAALPWWRPVDPLTGRAGLLSYAPSRLALALRDLAADGARVAAPQAWASWFEWAVPAARYLVDSRFELFPASVWADYGAIAGGGPGAREPLDRRAVDLVVVAADGAPPAGWVELYADEDGSIYGRPPD